MSLPLVSIGSTNATKAASIPSVAYTPRAIRSDFSNKTYVRNQNLLKWDNFFPILAQVREQLDKCRIVVFNFITIINNGSRNSPTSLIIMDQWSRSQLFPLKNGFKDTFTIVLDSTTMKIIWLRGPPFPWTLLNSQGFFPRIFLALINLNLLKRTFMVCLSRVNYLLFKKLIFVHNFT